VPLYATSVHCYMVWSAKVPLYSNRHSAASYHSGVANDTVPPVTATTQSTLYDKCASHCYMGWSAKVPLYSNRHSAASYHSGVANDTVPPVTVTVAPVPMLSDGPPLNTCQSKRAPVLLPSSSPKATHYNTQYTHKFTHASLTVIIPVYGHLGDKTFGRHTCEMMR